MRFPSTNAFILLCWSFGAWASVQGEDWTEFRGPTGQGISSQTGLPTHWSKDKNVAWSVEVPGKGWSSPILLGKRLFLTTAVPMDAGDAGPQSLRALCLDVASGKAIWDVEVFRQPGRAAIHKKNSHASPTPVTDGKRLFVHFGPHGTACLSLDSGEVVWRSEELKYSPVHGNGGSPVLVEGRLVVSCDGGDRQFVAGLDQQSGSVLWKTARSTQPVKGFSFGTPLTIEVLGKKQVVCPGADAVIAYDPRDGQEIWKVTYPGGYSVVPRPTFGAGTLFVCTGYDSPMLIAIRPEGAVGDVTETAHVVGRLKKGIPLNPSPLLVDDALYLISDDGLVTCLDARTLDVRWLHRVGGNFSASPVYADGKIYLQSEQGDGIVLKPGAEYQELATNPLEDRTLASYAIGDGTIFIRSEKRLTRVQEMSAAP